MSANPIHMPGLSLTLIQDIIEMELPINRTDLWTAAIDEIYI